MRAALFTAMLAFSLGACGGGEPGEPLLSSTGGGSVDGKAFTPQFGVSRVLSSGTVDSVLGTGEINCGNLSNQPASGIYVQVQVPEAKLGVPAKHFVHFSVVSGDSLSGGGSGGGSVEVTGLTETTIALSVDYDATIGSHHYTLAGAFELKRCP